MHFNGPSSRQYIFLLLFHCQKAAPWPIVADKRSPTILCILATGRTLLLLEIEFQSYLPQILINQTSDFKYEEIFIPKFLDCKL